MNDLPPVYDTVFGAVAANALKGGAAPITLQWKGSKIPRGQKINGIEIGWTQHGLVTGVGGEDLGTYERVVEFGGPNRDEHTMLIILSAPK